MVEMLKIAILSSNMGQFIFLALVLFFWFDIIKIQQGRTSGGVLEI